MDVRSLPEAFRSIMQARSWTQAELGAALGKDQGFVSRVVRGRQDPRMSTVMRFLDRVGLEVRITDKFEDDDPVKRREFVTAAASVAFIPSVPVDPFQDRLYLRELARRLHRDRLERGGGASVPMAMRYVRRVGQAVKGHDAQLQAAASDVASAAVWALVDAGRFDLGDGVGRLALELAQRSGDTDAHSRALSVLTKVQVYRGDAGEAVRYALQAVRLHEVPDVQRDYLTIRLGEALSIAPGQEHAARDVVESLRATLADAGARGKAPHEVADKIGNAGRLLYRLGAYQEAHTCLDEAMRSGPSTLQIGFDLAHQAKIALRIGEPDRAAEQMLILARFAPLVQSVRLNGMLHEVLALSARWRSVPEIRETHEYLQSLAPSMTRPNK